MNAVRCLFLLLLMIVGSGCASRGPAPKIVRVAVLDGITGYDVEPGGDLIEKGWWFGARDRFVSSNTGILLGERLAFRVSKLPGVEVYSREDLQSYMSQKERLLKRNYPDLPKLDRKKLLLQQDPLDFGKSLNVDYVVRSEVLESKTVTNRTLPWWYSRLSTTVEVWDVSRGQLVWRQPWKDQDNFDSGLAMVEECAKDIARAMKRSDAFGVYKP